MPGSTVLSRHDLDFLLYDWLGVDELPKRERFAEHSRETFDAILDLAAQIAEEQFAPHNKLNDADEPRVVDGKVRLNFFRHELPRTGPQLDLLAGLDATALEMDPEWF